MERNTTGLGENASEKPAAKEKLPAGAHFLCGWPLFMVAIGGAVGGALGGAAYGVNIAIYRSRLPAVSKVILNLATGAIAFGLWLAVAIWIESMRRKG